MLGLSIIAGRVTDDAGTPVRGALVGIAAGDDRAVGRTNGQGRFSLGVRSESPVRVMARRAGFTFCVRPGVPPWTQDLDLVIARAGSLAGRVVAEPMPRRFRLHMTRWHGCCPQPAKMLCVRRRRDGLFSVSHVPAGVYEVRVAADGYAPDGTLLELRAGEEVDGVELRLATR